MHKKTHFLLFFAILFVFAFSFYQGGITPVEALNPDITKYTEVFGWAWSGNSAGTNGIGWISMNSKNCANSNGIVSPVCGGPKVEKKYGVYFDKSATVGRNNLYGYAWSENIGWIKFGPDIYYGETNNRTADTGKEWSYIGAGGILQGYARACGFFKDNCSGVIQSQAGGWDGWIKMSGAKHTVKFFTNAGTVKGCGGTEISFDAGDFGGCAWGGETTYTNGIQTPGWISFSYSSPVSGGTDDGDPVGGGGCVNGGVCSGSSYIPTAFDQNSISCFADNYTYNITDSVVWKAFIAGGTSSGDYGYEWVYDSLLFNKTSGLLNGQTSQGVYPTISGKYSSGPLGIMNIKVWVMTNPAIKITVPCKDSLKINESVRIVDSSIRSGGIEMNDMKVKVSSNLSTAKFDVKDNLYINNPKITLVGNNCIAGATSVLSKSSVKGVDGVEKVSLVEFNPISLTVNSPVYLDIKIKDGSKWVSGLYDFTFKVKDPGGSCPLPYLSFTRKLNVNKSTGGTFQEF